MTKGHQSINPFKSAIEGLSKPIKTFNHFMRHSLDDVTEDAVTAVGFGIFAFSGLSTHVKILTSPLTYYVIKRIADFSGEYVESFFKASEQNIRETHDQNNFFYEFIDDVVEDGSKAICIASNNVPSIAAAAFAHSVGTTGRTSILKSAAEFIFGAFGYIKDYNECNELANAHGHWVVERLKELIGDSQTDNVTMCQAPNLVDEPTKCIGEVPEND